MSLLPSIAFFPFCASTRISSHPIGQSPSPLLSIVYHFPNNCPRLLSHISLKSSFWGSPSSHASPKPSRADCRSRSALRSKSRWPSRKPLSREVLQWLWRQRTSPLSLTVHTADALHFRHLCMTMRGVQKPGAVTTTSCMLGCFRTQQKTREEFLTLMNSKSRFF